MHRRQLSRALALSPFALLLSELAEAQGLASLSNEDATKGLKAALETGALTAVKLLGVQDGFLGNPRVRIPLPSGLQRKAATLPTSRAASSSGSGEFAL